MKVLTLLALFLVGVGVCFADSFEKKGMFLTPSVGVYAVAFAGGTLIQDGGPSGTLSLGYQMNRSWAFGAKVGGFSLVGPSHTLFAPLYAGFLEYRFSERVALGVELPVLPGLLLTVDSHQIGFTVLPLYSASGGSTIVSLSYGYRWKL